MPVYKLKARSNYGNMPEGYEFQVRSEENPPNAVDIKEEIERLGFDVQGYTHSGSYACEQISMM